MVQQATSSTDELYSLLSHAFGFSERGRAQVIGSSDELDTEADAILARLTPAVASIARGGAERLTGVLWELSDGDWQRAQRLLEAVGRPRLDLLLGRLRNGLEALIERAPAGGAVWTPARDELRLRRAALPTRALLGPPDPAQLNREKDPTPSGAPITKLVPRRLDEILAELRSMPGMRRVHEQVSDLVAELEVANARSQAGLPAAGQPIRHIALVGPPGTGKTTVARLLAELYASLGMLDEATLLETGRSGLVGMYSGHTAHRTADAVARAIGGVLFIDEAYSLAGDSYGDEALAELVRLMENHRDDLVVILAGYPKEMGHFIAQNPGLASRIGAILEFEPYSNDELVEIVDLVALEAGYLLEAPVLDLVDRWLDAERDREGFGNARAARGLVESMIRQHARRIRTAGLLHGDHLFVLTPDDVPEPHLVVVDTPHSLPAAGYV